MHRQILVIIGLNLATAPGYLLMGFLYTSMVYETIWFLATLPIAMYGYHLYKQFDIDMTIKSKDIWLTKIRVFMFAYSFSWAFMFFYYVSSDNPEMHYITIATELGSSVVAATLLASQRKLVIFTVVGLMVPLTIYFVALGDIYSYILAFFSLVLTAVILYAAKNTNDYITKSNYQAYHDHLTQLGNRRYFLEILESSVRENKDKYSYLLLIDLDYFKTINDTLGHDIGDALLREVSTRMKNISKNENNHVARLGGDEFCVLSDVYDDRETCLESARTFADDLLAEIKRNYFLGSNHIHISASIGVSLVNSENTQASEFLKEADMAMYEAKNNGRDGVILFDASLSELVQKKLKIEQLLHFSLEEQEIYLNYQPQVDLNKKIIGCEVLARWNNKELGNIAPDMFISIAENSSFIIELGAYILEESFKTIRDWSKKGISLEQVSINISMRQLIHQDFSFLVKSLVDEYIDDNSKIKIIFEITETSTTEDRIHLIAIINRLEKYNIFFSMDDFGTGYSSLSYLQNIPIKELKIDQSFISKIDDAQQVSLVKTIIDISKNFGLVTVAEGVEHEYQRDILKRLGCDIFQGYLFSKPLNKTDFESFYNSDIYYI